MKLAPSRRFLFGALGLLTVGCLAAGWLWRRTGPSSVSITPADVQAARLKLGDVPPPAQSAPKALPWKQTVRLAVGNLGLADAAQDRELNDLLTAQLSGARGLELVERRNLEAVLRETELNLSGVVRAREAVRAGKLLRADWFLLGTLAPVHGTNCLVVRLVDAHSGVTRNGAVLVQKPMLAWAAEVADFVRQERQAAAEAKPQVYLAIGTFEDLSVNDRQATFPSQLRGYLTAAYQHSQFTLLEREYADLLLREMELDLGGLTEDGTTNPPALMTSAFWLVDGSYQSYETSGLGLELTLQVQRIFGTATEVSLRGPPGEPLCHKIKAAIDGVVNRAPVVVLPSRVSELRAQKAHGRNLFNSGNPGHAFGADVTLVYVRENQWGLDPEREAKRTRNLQEAMRAFQTMLLLDPGNHEAKMYLAACLRAPSINRLDEAREYYHQIIEDPVQDQWSGLAQRALAVSFEGTDPSEAARFFGSAERRATNSQVAAFYRQQAQRAEERTTLSQGEGPKVEALAEQQLFESLGSCNETLHGRGGSFSTDLGMSSYARAFGTNQAQAGRRLVELLPRMEQQFPELRPYLLATVVSFQEETNLPVIAQCQELLGQLSQQPTNVLAPSTFWYAAKTTLAEWSFRHKLYPLAVQVMEGSLRLPPSYHPVRETERDTDRIGLAYAHMGLKQWTNALEILETFSNQPVRMQVAGPWGESMSVLSTSDQAAYCRQKLGLAPVQDPREFHLHKTGFCFCSLGALAAGESPSAFAASPDGLWVALNGQLLQLDFSLRTNLVVNLPIASDVPVTCLCLEATNIWMGTDGAGVLEYDKSRGQCRHLTQEQGLLMNQVAALHLSGNTLWIGYGRRSRYAEFQSEGGLGKLDLTTGQTTSFTPSIKVVQNTASALLEPADQPSRRSVSAIAEGANGDIWFLVEEQTPRLRRYRPGDGSWAAAQQACSCLVADSTRLVLGQHWNESGGAATGPLGVSLLDSNAGQWRSLAAAEGLPAAAVTALALDGNDLWVGGMGYVAILQLPEGRVRKFARVRTGSVDQLEIGGGYVWARYNGHLYRALLAEAR